MGSCCSTCAVCPRTYDVRKKHNVSSHAAITPTPSVSEKMEVFDNLSHVSTSRTSKMSQVTPSTQPPHEHNGQLPHIVYPTDKAEPLPPTSSTTTTLPYMISRESSEILSSPEFRPKRCDSISNKSVDSDLGSECLSMAQSSARSDRNNVVEVMPANGDADGSLTSKMSEESQSYGTLTRSRGRSAFNASRLGHREFSATSTRSMDILYWKKGDRLGSGSFGTVWLGLTNQGELIAVKQMQLNASLSDFNEADKEYDKIYQEVTILKGMMHRNIVGYLGSSYDNGNVSIFMEYVAGGSLGSVIQKFGPLDENIASRYTKQLLDAITYMHRNSVVHRDIKSANIMLTPNGTIKLIDFGCAKKLELRLSRSGSHLMKSLRGTPYWMAPEVINETGHGKKSDIWSLGCTLFEMLTGSPPWGDREPIAAIFAIGSEEFPIPQLPTSFSSKAQDFTKRCMLRNKHKRPTADRLLMHQFVDNSPLEEEVSTSRQTSIESSLSIYHGSSSRQTSIDSANKSWSRQTSDDPSIIGCRDTLDEVPVEQ